jgi:hypothetical protein
MQPVMPPLEDQGLVVGINVIVSLSVLVAEVATTMPLLPSSKGPYLYKVKRMIDYFTASLELMRYNTPP